MVLFKLVVVIKCLIGRFIVLVIIFVVKLLKFLLGIDIISWLCLFFGNCVMVLK